MNWLKGVPYSVLIGGSVLMALLPFSAESHLLEKLGMLMHGDLTKPIDIFDLLLHSSPMILLAVKIILERNAKKTMEDSKH